MQTCCWEICFKPKLKEYPSTDFPLPPKFKYAFIHPGHNPENNLTFVLRGNLLLSSSSKTGIPKGNPAQGSDRNIFYNFPGQSKGIP